MRYRLDPGPKATLRIAFISPFIYRYHRGIERFTTDLANQLTQLGQKVTIMTWAEPGGSVHWPIDPSVRIRCVPWVRWFQAYWAIPFYITTLLRYQFDIVNIFFAGYGEAEALCLVRRFRSFRVNFIAGYPIEQVPHRFREFRRCGLHKTLNRIIVKSPSMAPGIAGFFGREVDIIPNGVDTEAFNPGRVDAEPVQHRFGIRDKDQVLLTVAALEERKGVQSVIRVLPDLLQAGFSVHYFVVGDGSYRKTLEALAAEHQVVDRVHFVGAVTDVLPYYQLADVFLLLSYGEGFPNVLLEAWAMGLPVVVSKHPPYPSIVPRGVGFIVDEKDSADLRNTLITLLNSPETQQEIGQAARCHVEEHYAWPVVARRYLELFSDDSGRPHENL